MGALYLWRDYVSTYPLQFANSCMARDNFTKGIFRVLGNVQNFLNRDFLGNKDLKKIMESNIVKQNCSDKKIKDLEMLLEQQNGIYRNET